MGILKEFEFQFCDRERKGEMVRDGANIEQLI